MKSNRISITCSTYRESIIDHKAIKFIEVIKVFEVLRLHKLDKSDKLRKLNLFIKRDL